MLKRMTRLYLLITAVAVVLSVKTVYCLTQVPAETEERLRAIYERREFRAKSVRATWLEDGSGYTVNERLPGSNDQVQVLYDAASGKRTVLDSPAKEETGGRSGITSPDGKFILYYEQGNLHLRNLSSDQTIPLTKNAVKGSVGNGRAIWSPNSRQIAFVERDDSDVRFRSMLIPGDPSYPEVRKRRFARVGEIIPKQTRVLHRRCSLRYGQKYLSRIRSSLGCRKLR